MTYLIAGNGPAAVHAVYGIRKLDLHGKIIMASPENNIPYSRITIPEYLTNEIEEKNIYFVDEGFYEKHGIETRLGVSVMDVAPDKHIAALSNGDEIRYDKLLLATGSRPFMPAWADKSTAGVFSLWNKSDCEIIAAYMKPEHSVVIIGGGLVGMQAARALRSKGMNVTVIELAERLMAQQLDNICADMLLAAAERAGVRVRLRSSVECIVEESGKLKGVKLDDGTVLGADMLLVCVGVRPNLSMLDGLDIPHERGIEVDDHMRTALPDIFAAGDVAIAPAFPGNKKKLRAIWPNAVEQGETAGENMAGGGKIYEGSRSMNSIELFGLPLVTAGESLGGDGLNELVITPPSGDVYVKLVLNGETLEGMIFAGEIEKSGVMLQKLGRTYRDGFGFSAVNPEEIYY